MNHRECTPCVVGPGSIIRLMPRLSSRTPHRFCTRVLICFLLGLCAHSAQAATAPPRELLVASADEHLWFITKDPNTPATWRLMHHSVGMNGAYARVARTLESRPLALAARDDQVLVLMPPTVQRGSTLDLLRLRVQRNPAMGTFFDRPLDGWDVLASVPHASPLGGLAFSARSEPLALLLPDKRLSEGVSRTRGSRKEAPSPARLIRQVGFDWLDVALPAELLERSQQSLLPGLGLSDAVILDADSEGKARLHRYSGAEWSSESLPIEMDSVLRVTSSEGRLVYAVLEENGTISIHIERGDSLLKLAETTRPEGQWGLASTGEALLILETDDEGVIRVRAIDSIQGTVGDPVEWTRLPLEVSDWLHLPLIGMLVVAALLAIVLFRPSELPDAPLRAGVKPMVLSRRMVALAIDFIPGVLLALLLFDTDLASVASIPLWSSELAFAGPGLVIIGVTIFHETVSELIWHRSIGKFLMGGRVLASDGSSPGSGSILLRQLFKTVVLYAPILAIFVILSPAFQGIPETVSRTVVSDSKALQDKENHPEVE